MRINLARQFFFSERSFQVDKFFRDGFFYRDELFVGSYFFIVM